MARVLWLVMAGCFTVASGTAHAVAVPLVAEGSVRANPVLLVKSKKAKAAEESASEDMGDPADRGVMDYLKAAITFSDWEVTPEVEDNKIGSWILGALFATYGGHIWAPMVFFKDVPKNKARTNAMILGVLGIFTPAIMCGAFVLLPCAIVPILGWLVYFGAFITLGAISAIMNWYVIPKAITLAYSDAYLMADEGGGSGDDEDRPKKKKKKKKKIVDEEDEEAPAPAAAAD